MSVTTVRPRTVATTIGILFLAGTLAALAAITPYDFTGHWAGSATAMGRGGRTEMLTVTADLVAGTAPNLFTGNASVAELQTTCQVKGKLKKALHVKMRLDQCTNGNRPARLHGTVDPTTQTIAGNFVGHKVHGTFSITRSPAA